MSEKVLLILSTFPDREKARQISATLVQEKLAACANILPGVESTYWWQDKVESAEEVLVLFKAPSTLFDRFSARLRSLHPYEVPEIIALDVAAGLPDYLSWVLQTTS